MIFSGSFSVDQTGEEGSRFDALAQRARTKNEVVQLSIVIAKHLL